MTHQLKSVTSVLDGCLIILGVVMLGTVVYGVMHTLHPKFQNEEIGLRIRAWWVVAAVFTLSLFAGTPGLFLLLVGLGVLGSLELVRLMRLSRSMRGVSIGLLSLSFILLIGFPGDLFWSGLAILANGGLLLMATPTPSKPWSALAGIALDGALIAWVLLTELNDVMQFLWGKSLGRKPILPRINPSKTRVGLIGGVASTAVFSIILNSLFLGFPPGIALGVGLMIGISGFFGDVLFSIVKRSAEAKNSGTALPGHGGILDRIDSLSLSAPVFLTVMWLIFTPLQHPNVFNLLGVAFEIAFKSES